MAFRVSVEETDEYFCEYVYTLYVRRFVRLCASVVCVALWEVWLYDISSQFWLV